MLRLRSRWVRLLVPLHLAAPVVWGLRPGWWPWIVSVLVASHLATVVGGLLPRSSLVGPNLTRLPDGAPEDAVGLTFDDGPDADVTPRVLALLRRRGVRATFFCIGRKAERHPELIRAIESAGHRVENHTFAHSSWFSFQPPWSAGRDIDRAQRVLTGEQGPPRYFRAPAGIRNPWLDFVLQRRRLELVSWTRRGFDTNTPDPERVLRRLCAGLRGGDILLLHDGSSAVDDQGSPVVLSVLPRLLDTIEDAGLRAVPLPRG